MKKALLVILSMTLIACNTMVSLGGTKATYSKNGQDAANWALDPSNDTTVINDANNKTSKKSVKVSINGNSEVYSVDITWDTMEFTYTSGGWNPENHQYTSSTGWSDANNTIKVENHSNKPVTAAFAFSSTSKDATVTDNITGSFLNSVNGNGSAVAFTNNKYTLETGEGKQKANAAYITETLTLSGTPTKSYSSATVGDVTVTIGEVNS